MLRRFIILTLFAILATTSSLAQKEKELLHFHHFNTDIALPDSRMSDILEDKMGNIWMTTMYGVCRFDGYSLSIYKTKDGKHSLPDCRAGLLYLDKNGTLWIKFKASGSVVYYRYDTDDFVTVAETDVPEGMEKYISDRSSMTVTDGKHVWKKRNNDLIQYSKTDNDSIIYRGNIAVTAGLQDSIVSAILMTKDKRLWLATVSGGVYYAFTGNNGPKTFLQKSSVAIKALCADSNGGLFLGYEYGGVAYTDMKRSKVTPVKYPGMNSETGSRIRHLMIDSRKRLWIASRCGIYIDTDCRGKYKHLLLHKDTASTANRVYRLLEDKRHKCIWAATWDGLAKISSGKLAVVGQLDRSARKIHDIAMAHDGTLWIASEDGIYRKGYGDKAATLILPDRLCYAIGIAEDNSVWCGTDDGVIFIRNGAAIPEPLPQTEGKDMSVKGIVCKGKYAYIATGTSLLRIDTQSLKAESVTFGEYEYAEGAYYLNPMTQEILFGSTQGIVAIDSDVDVNAAEEEGNDHVPALLYAALSVAIGLLAITVFIIYRKKTKANTAVTEITETDIDTPAVNFTELQNQEFLNRCDNIIMEHIGDSNFDINEFAKEMATSRAQLFRKMKAANGMTPINYLMSIRIRKAEEMLRSTAKTITEISFACGFNDPAAFRRNFHKMHGVTPKQYRSSLSCEEKQ